MRGTDVVICCCCCFALDLELPPPSAIQEDSADARAFLRSALRDVDASEAVGEDATAAKMMDKLFERTVEPELAQPTFVMDHPMALSPLAKQHR